MDVTMTGRRVTRLAKILVDALWWVSVVLTAIMGALVLFFPVPPGTSVTAAVRVSIPDHAARELLPLAWSNPDFSDAPVITDLEGMLEIPPTSWIVLMVSTVVVLTVIAVLYGLYILRAFLRDVLANQVFTDANALRLSRLGWLLVAAGAALPTIEYVYGRIALRYAAVSGVALTTTFDFPEIVLAGLLILVVAAAWRYGVQLQQDHDLTV